MTLTVDQVINGNLSEEEIRQQVLQSGWSETEGQDFLEDLDEALAIEREELQSAQRDLRRGERGGFGGTGRRSQEDRDAARAEARELQDRTRVRLDEIREMIETIGESLQMLELMYLDYSGEAAPVVNVGDIPFNDLSGQTIEVVIGGGQNLDLSGTGDEQQTLEEWLVENNYARMEGDQPIMTADLDGNGLKNIQDYNMAKEIYEGENPLHTRFVDFIVPADYSVRVQNFDPATRTITVIVTSPEGESVRYELQNIGAETAIRWNCTLATEEGGDLRSVVSNWPIELQQMSYPPASSEDADVNFYTQLNPPDEVSEEEQLNYIEGARDTINATSDPVAQAIVEDLFNLYNDGITDPEQLRQALNRILDEHLGSITVEEAMTRDTVISQAIQDVLDAIFRNSYSNFNYFSAPIKARLQNILNHNGPGQMSSDELYYYEMLNAEIPEPPGENILNQYIPTQDQETGDWTLEGLNDDLSEEERNSEIQRRGGIAATAGGNLNDTYRELGRTPPTSANTLVNGSDAFNDYVEAIQNGTYPQMNDEDLTEVLNALPSKAEAFNDYYSHETGASDVVSTSGWNNEGNVNRTELQAKAAQLFYDLNEMHFEDMRAMAQYIMNYFATTGMHPDAKDNFAAMVIYLLEQHAPTLLDALIEAHRGFAIEMWSQIDDAGNAPRFFEEIRGYLGIDG